MNEDKKQFIIKSLKEGASLRQIAKVLNMPHSTLALWIRKDDDLQIAQNYRDTVIMGVLANY